MDMEFITLWTPGVKKQPNFYFQYSRIRMQMFFNIRTCECELKKMRIFANIRIITSMYCIFTTKIVRKILAIYHAATIILENSSISNIVWKKYLMRDTQKQHDTQI